MLTWIFLILIHAPVDAPHPTVAIATLSSHVIAYTRRDSEDCLPDPSPDILRSEDEREGEEEGGDDSHSPWTASLATHELRVRPVCAAIAVANLRVSGLLLGMRVAILRC